MNFKTLMQNSVIRFIVILVIIIIILYVLTKLLNYINKRAKSRPYLIKGPKDAKKPLMIPRSTFINSTVGRQFTYSLWVNVKDWGYNYSKPKHVFHVGDKEGHVACPSVWLYPKNNNLMIRIDTYDRKADTLEQNPNYATGESSIGINPQAQGVSPTVCNAVENFATTTTEVDISKLNCVPASGKKILPGVPTPSMNPHLNPNMFDPLKQCDIVNIPVQRWNHIVITVNNKTLDVYLNGKLARSCTFNSLPKLNNGNVYVNQFGGYDGLLSDLLYVNRAISANEVYGLYLAGSEKFSLWDELARLGIHIPTIKIQASVDME